MYYYYALVRFHISNQIHIRNRRNLDKSWKHVLEARRRLRVVTPKKIDKKIIKEDSHQ